MSDLRASIEQDFASWIEQPRSEAAKSLAAFASLNEASRDIVVSMAIQYVAGSGQPLPYEAAISLAESGVGPAFDWTTSALPTLALLCGDTIGVEVSATVVATLAPEYRDLTVLTLICAGALNTLDPVVLAQNLAIPSTVIDRCWDDLAPILSLDD